MFENVQRTATDILTLVCVAELKGHVVEGAYHAAATDTEADERECVHLSRARLRVSDVNVLQ